jgi:formyl-CoA transferase
MTERSLTGIRVLDVSTLFAGPLAATLLGDFGADVIKVEQPGVGDPSRDHGYQKDGIGLWWKTIGRNKRTVTLNLREPDGQELFKKLAATADVIIENFRPGVLESWGIGWDVLSELNPGLIMARVTAYGQFGPKSSLRGFGTIAEAMSGFASITGVPDGPPTLPPFGLADGITGLTTAFGILVALRARDRSARGQMLDVAIIEPIMTLLGAQPIVYDQLGIRQGRTGNRSYNNAPRNTYRSRDGKWIAISSSAPSIARRVVTLVGAPELVDEPWFDSARGRAEHVEQIDSVVAAWISRRNADIVIEEFSRAGAAATLIYDIADIFTDPQYQALDTITRVNDEDLGEIRMQNVVFRLSDTPGEIRWSGRKLGEFNEEIYGSLGVAEDELQDLRERGVV